MAESIQLRGAVPATADVVVIGGGVVGAATAFCAAQAGLTPVVLERRRLPGTLTTAASTGAFRLQFDNEEELDLVRESRDLFLEFQAVTGQRAYDLGLRLQGYLFVTTDEERAAWQRRLVTRQHGWGLSDVEFMDGDAVRDLFPHIAPHVVHARFRAGDGFLDPKQLTCGLLAGAGCDVVTDCEVTAIACEGARVTGVRTSRGDIACDRVVIAAGPFAGRVASMAGVDLPVKTITRHKVVLPAVPEVPRDAPMTIDDDTGAHWRPALEGAYALFTDPEAPAGPAVDPVPSDPDFAERVLDPASPVSIARVTPFWADVWRRGSVRWMLQSGQYTVTPDRRPLIGPTRIEGLYVNAGYSGHGVMGSPAGGRILVDVMTGTLEAEKNPFRLDREFVERDGDLL